jgi:hypothetical protein
VENKNRDLHQLMNFNVNNLESLLMGKENNFKKQEPTKEKSMEHFFPPKDQPHHPYALGNRWGNDKGDSKLQQAQSHYDEMSKNFNRHRQSISNKEYFINIKNGGNAHDLSSDNIFRTER